MQVLFEVLDEVETNDLSDAISHSIVAGDLIVTFNGVAHTYPVDIKYDDNPLAVRTGGPIYIGPPEQTGNWFPFLKNPVLIISML